MFGDDHDPRFEFCRTSSSTVPIHSHAVDMCPRHGYESALRAVRGSASELIIVHVVLEFDGPCLCLIWRGVDLPARSFSVQGLMRYRPREERVAPFAL